MRHSFVLDNSVAMRWCFEDATHPYAETILRYLSDGSEAIVPVLWYYEATSVLTKAQRSGALSVSKAEAFIQDLEAFTISTDIIENKYILSDVRQVALQYALTGYDAAYLELALRKKIALATLDQELIAAAQKAGVPIME